MQSMHRHLSARADDPGKRGLHPGIGQRHRLVETRQTALYEFEGGGQRRRAADIGDQAPQAWGGHVADVHEPVDQGVLRRLTERSQAARREGDAERLHRVSRRNRHRGLHLSSHERARLNAGPAGV